MIKFGNLLIFLLFIGSFISLISPLFYPGLAMGSDVLMHTGNIVIVANLLSHKLPPWNWIPDIAGGYGGPNFLYYGYAGFLIPAILLNLGLSLEISIKIWLASIFIVGVISSFLMSSLVGEKYGGFLGSLLFIWSPYYFTLAYVRGSYPEFNALSLYPLFFYFLHCLLTRERSTIYLLCAAITFSIIYYIHTLSLIILGIYLFLYTIPVWVIYRRKIKGKIFMLSGLTILLSANALVGPVFYKGRIDLTNQFLNSTLYKSSALPWYAMINKEPLNLVISSYIVPGRVHLLSLLGAVCLGIQRRSLITIFLVSLSILSLLFAIDLFASVVIDVFPFLNYLQFPWRFLSMYSLFCSLSSASGLKLVSPSVRKVILLVVPLVTTFFYFPSIPIQPTIDIPFKNTKDIRRSLTTLDQENKYIPIKSKLPKAPVQNEILHISGDVKSEVSLSSIDLNDYTFNINTSKEVVAFFNQYWFENWMLEIDGQRKTINRGGELGICTFEVPKGTHKIHIYFSESKFMRITKYCSIITWLTVFFGVIALLIKIIWRRFTRNLQKMTTMWH